MAMKLFKTCLFVLSFFILCDNDNYFLYILSICYLKVVYLQPEIKQN